MRFRIPRRPQATYWDHNGRYHEFLLHRLPARPARALDVGCGTGAFARRLAQRAEAVDAVDVSTQMIAAAEAASAGIGNVRCLLGDIRTLELEPGSYDVVTAIASVHHLPAGERLLRLAELVRPGGPSPSSDWPEQPHFRTTSPAFSRFRPTSRSVSGRPRAGRHRAIMIAGWPTHLSPLRSAIRRPRSRRYGRRLGD
jgi:SAM-dependent methyltransferase